MTELAYPAMILAAGYGKRMRAHCDTLPKPLVPVAGKPLIEYPLTLLRHAGVQKLVVNVHYMADAIAGYLREQGEWQVMFSEEPELLETGGGIVNALPKLASETFFVLNSDVLCIDVMPPILQQMAQNWDERAMDALLLFVPLNRAAGYEGKGDFALSAKGMIEHKQEGKPAYVYSGIQLLHRRFFEGAPAGAFRLGDWYRHYLNTPDKAPRLQAMVHPGEWFHVGDGQGVKLAEDYLLTHSATA
jgi:N-acetyl-alpha-D-muramate 1-phosphate uridylyltransferase